MNNVQENGIITLMRGDSFSTPIYINIGTKLVPEYYTLTPNDRLYFGLMEPSQAFEDAVLKRVFDFTDERDVNNNTLLKLRPQDTEKLLVGKYYYMIKLRSIEVDGEETVKTVVPPTLFWLEGNNVKIEEEKYYQKGHYEIERIIIEGGEIL